MIALVNPALAAAVGPTATRIGAGIVTATGFVAMSTASYVVGRKTTQILGAAANRIADALKDSVGTLGDTAPSDRRAERTETRNAAAWERSKRARAEEIEREIARRIQAGDLVRPVPAAPARENGFSPAE